MKLRILFLTLALAAVFAFTACGGSAETANVTPVSESSMEETRAESEKESEEEIKEETAEEPEEATEAPAEASKESSDVSESSEPAAETAEGLPAGLYHLVGMTQGGEVVSTQDLVTMEELGYEMYIEINDDGTGVLNLYGVGADITWDGEGITANDETIPYEWDGKYLSLSNDDTSVTFSTLTAQEIIDAGEGVEGTVNFFEEDEDLYSLEPTVDVTVSGADWVKNYEDEEVFVVWLDITNISDDYIYPSWDAYCTAAQNGTELEYGYVDEEDVPETGNNYRSCRPGITIRCANTYAADKEGGTIEYKITSGMSDEEILNMEFDPANLPGPPAEEIELEKIENIDWLDGAEDSGIYSDTAEVVIKDCEFLEGYDGKKLMRVWFNYRNTGDEAESFYMATSVRAVQDGVSLDVGYTSYDDASADLKSQDVEPGEALDVCLDFELMSDSPVAVEFIVYTSEDVIAKVFDVK